MSGENGQVEKRPIEQSGPYSEVEQQRALMALAFNNGNATRTIRELKGDVDVSRRTLVRWKERRREDYDRIRREVVAAVRERQAEGFMAAVDDLGELEAKLIAASRKHIKDLSPRDLPGALRNVTVSKGINADKAEAGATATKPPESVQTFEQNMDFLRRNLPPEILRELLLRPVPVESTAEEITDAQIERTTPDD